MFGAHPFGATTTGAGPGPTGDTPAYTVRSATPSGWKVGAAAVRWISALATDTITWPVTATVNGVSYDPTGDTVRMAFTALTAQPAGTDWVTGTWGAGPLPGTWPPIWLAGCLIGPNGDASLTVGEYQVWVQVTDGTHTRIFQPGTLTVQ